jgi:4-amino-4-deoxy-L-arabinose transferase-like glycosyltransferase
MTALVASDARAAETESATRSHRWRQPALVGLLAVTAALYLWDLSASGYANTFYAAAAQAGSRSWKAWFFGSLDAQNFITVDKPPASLWVIGLSIRLFGMNSLAVLVPQALMGAASVALLYATVRRSVPESPPPATAKPAAGNPGRGAVAGLLAGAVLALTPAAALMFRFDNPDALLVLLMTVGAYCLTRALQPTSPDGSTSTGVPAGDIQRGWWLALVGLALGTAFITKMLQGLLVLPAFGLTYLLLAPTGWAKRVAHLLGAAVALLVAAGWWVLTVQLWPAATRPYIGGSTNNSVLDLAFGYNGVSRLVGGPAPAEPTAGHWAAPRGGFAGSALDGATGLRRMFSAEMGYEISWLLPVALFAIVFGVYLAVRGQLSHGETCALVMWSGWLLVTGLVFSTMGGVVHPYYVVALAPAVAALVGLGGWWAWRQRGSWDGRIALAAMVVLAAWWSVRLLHHAAFGPAWTRWAIAVLAVAAAVGVLGLRRRALTAAAVIGLLAGLGGTAAFTVATVATPHHGAVPVAVNVARTGVLRGGPWLGDGATSSVIAEMLAATSTMWSAATDGSQTAAALEIASGTSVMAIGGWNGDPVPTLGQFIDDVRAGRIAYYVQAGHPPPGTPSSTGTVGAPAAPGTAGRTRSHAQEIADWVARNYPARIVGAMTMYRLV